LAQNTQNNLVRRLLGTTLLMIATNAALTLIAQPPSYWRSPQSAIRFDRLPIHSSTNPMFDFFLGHGWHAYLACVTLYATAVWFVMSLLPKKLALIAELTIILGLCYSGSNWIVNHWNTGTGGAMLYVAAVAILLANVVVPIVAQPNRTDLSRLCWLMASTTAIDGILTLIGQPTSYWHNTLTVHEGNPMSKYLLEQGWWAYGAYNLVEIAVPWLIAQRASRQIGWTIAFGFTLGGLFGGSNWLFYEDRLGLQAPVIYGTLLSILIVQFVLNRDQRATSQIQSPNESRKQTSNDADDVNSREVFDCC
jgi:hypothetical protein